MDEEHRQTVEAFSQALIQRGELQAEVARLRAALQAVEWVFEEYAPSCPWCKRLRDDKQGHRSDCQRQLALGLTVKE